jgi:hypothetical protein
VDTAKRREEILKLLQNAQKSVKGTELAEQFGVSRQVIVQDIAILRANGINILATPQGYLLPVREESKALRRTIVCNHKGYDSMEEELRIIVDLGGKIIDVIVDHPLYGEIKSPINIESRYDLAQFMDNIKETNAEPLSSLTGGLHLHTIEVKDQKTFELIKKELKGKNYLINED